jgi:hypothetical protein
VALAYDLEPLRGESGTIYAHAHRYQLQGALVADSESAMDAAYAALAAAYYDGRDLALVFTAGGDTTLLLETASCNGGTKVTRGPSLPEMRNAAYTAYLPYAITVEGEIEATGRNTDLLSFTETIQRSGGGPRYAMRETLNSLPIRQQVRRSTIYRVTQSGTAVGLYSYPQVPPPLFPAALLEAPVVTLVSPKRRGGAINSRTYTEFAVQWSYSYESAGPMAGSPTLWR